MKKMVRPARLAIHLPSWRRRMLLLGVLAGFAILIGRALYLQGVHKDFLQQKGEARYSRTLTLPAHRGMITDRHGEALAISTPVESIWASPPDVVVSDAQLAQLAGLLRVSPAELRRKLANSQREFVYLKRRLPPDEAVQVMRLGIRGIFSQREYRRYYPAAEVAAHVVGFTDIDDRGQEGLELVYQEWLAGKPGSRRVLKDRQGRIVEDLEAVKVPQDGRDLVLSIDRNIQYLAHRELAAAVTGHKAKAGAIVVLDARSGEVLALANQPSYNPNNPVKLAGKARNRVIVDIFEPGSTLKPFTAAAALEAGQFRPETRIDTAPGYLRIGRKTIRDVHPHEMLSVAEVIQKSSNVGSAKMALSLQPQFLWNLFNQVGFGSPVNVGFPGEAAGRLRPYKTWKPIEQATMSYGHGISLSLLQLARAYTIFAGDGDLKPVSLRKLKSAPVGQPVVSAHTAHAVRAMLEMATQVGGTAPKAQVPGYRVAGKTGTAHKLGPGGYLPDSYVSSFVGLAPVSDPRLIIAVMIDEPGAGKYYGGTVAAPVFSAVMAGALRLLSVPQDAPLNNVVLPPDDVPEIREMV